MSNILIIDDSNFSRSMLKRTLGTGHTFFEAPNGEEGILAFEREKPDVVFLDLTMPGMNGLEVLEILREKDPKARIIIGSADIQEYSQTRAKELGAITFIAKPFTTDIVQAALKLAIDGQSR